MWYRFDGVIEILGLTTPCFIVSCEIMGSFAEITSLLLLQKLPVPLQHAATMSERCDARSLALSACVKLVCDTELDTSRKLRREEGEADDEFVVVVAAIQQSTVTDDGCTAEYRESDEELECWYEVLPQRLLQSKPRGRGSQIEAWVTDPFWRTDSEFQCNLHIKRKLSPPLS